MTTTPTPTYASEFDFLYNAHPGESYTYTSSRDDRLMVTYTLTAVDTEPDLSADGSRHVTCTTLTTQHRGRAEYVSYLPERCYMSTVSTDDVLEVEVDERGCSVITGHVNMRGMTVGLVEGVARFSRKGLEAAHAAAVEVVAKGELVEV